MSDVAAVYARLKAETVTQLGYDPDKLSPSQEARVGMIVGLKLEADRLASEQLAGRPVDPKALLMVGEALESALRPGEYTAAGGGPRSDARERLRRLIETTVLAADEIEAERLADAAQREEAVMSAEALGLGEQPEPPSPSPPTDGKVVPLRAEASPGPAAGSPVRPNGGSAIPPAATINEAVAAPPLPFEKGWHDLVAIGRVPPLPPAPHLHRATIRLPQRSRSPRAGATARSRGEPIWLAGSGEEGNEHVRHDDDGHRGGRADASRAGAETASSDREPRGRRRRASRCGVQGAHWRRCLTEEAQRVGRTRWCKTLPMARYCARRDVRFMPHCRTVGKPIPRNCRKATRIAGATCTEAGLIEKATGLLGQGRTQFGGTLGPR
jgi:hypothetical protein